MSLKKNVQNWLKISLEDPIAKLLANNSHLTKTQLETILIDVLAENLSSKRLKYVEKARLRRTKAPVSRGSFNRTLRQAKTNVVKSIYTILLLGYFGILESTSLTPYLEVGNKLKDYAKAYRTIQSDSETDEAKRLLILLRDELEESFSRLSEPWTTSTS